MPNIRIISDGTLQGTHVLDSAGNEIDYITDISWKINSIQDCAEVLIKIINVPIEMTIPARERAQANGLEL